MRSTLVSRGWRSSWMAAAAVGGFVAVSVVGPSQVTETLVIRQRPQTLHVYGERGQDPVIVSSSDGGWVRLGPHIAELLASRGYFVVGFNSRAYLESFTSGGATLTTADEPQDYARLAEWAGRGSVAKPILIGVSEGAGLSILAASDPQTHSRIGGVVGIGMPDVAELGWRWRDAVIYFTHGVPNEPTFSTAALVDRVAPIPLADIHSTHDEFLSVPEAQAVFARAKDPKRLRVIPASDHRFSDAIGAFDVELLDTLTWVKQHVPR